MDLVVAPSQCAAAAAGGSGTDPFNPRKIGGITKDGMFRIRMGVAGAKKGGRAVRCAPLKAGSRRLHCVWLMFCQAVYLHCLYNGGGISALHTANNGVDALYSFSASDMVVLCFEAVPLPCCD